MKNQYDEKMEAWLKTQPMRVPNGLSISDTYTTMKWTTIEDTQPMSIHQPHNKKWYNNVDTKKLNEFRAIINGHGWKTPRVVERKPVVENPDLWEDY